MSSADTGKVWLGKVAVAKSERHFSSPGIAADRGLPGYHLVIYITKEDRQREALAQKGAQALATIAGWQTEAGPVMLPPQLSGFHYCAAADIVLVHWRRNISIGRLFLAARETRLDILRVEPAWIGSEGPTFCVSLILCRAGETTMYRALRLWSADIDGPVWLVPDPHDADLDYCCIDLTQRRLTPTDHMPFADAGARDSGLLTGKLRWKAIMGGHLI